MESERIPLTTSESDIIRQLRELRSNLPEGYFSTIEEILRHSRVLLTAVVETSPHELHWGQLTLLGVLYRTHELFLGGLEQLCRDRKHVWAACVRALIETFGATVFVSEKPNRLESLVRDPGVTAGRLRSAARRRISQLRADLDWLDAIVHPGTTSMLLGMRMVNETDGFTIFGVPPLPLGAEEVDKGVDALISVCRLIHEEVEAILYRSAEAITAGQALGVSVSRAGRV